MKKKVGGTLSFVAASAEVLRSEGRPLNVNEITELAIQRGLIHPKGKTPAATMSAKLYVGIRDDSFPIERLAEPSPKKAKRGSVKWKLKDK